jgi:hypothetical protein
MDATELVVLEQVMERQRQAHPVAQAVRLPESA